MSGGWVGCHRVISMNHRSDVAGSLTYYDRALLAGNSPLLKPVGPRLSSGFDGRGTCFPISLKKASRISVFPIAKISKVVYSGINSAGGIVIVRTPNAECRKQA